MLPAEFYGAVQFLDADGELAFRVTDEQLTAGIMLYRGAVVEMSAGEGKTVAAAFPAMLHALTDRRVHVVTANDYLAARDAEWLADVYEALGVSVSAVLGHMGDADRRAAYRSRIVYGTVRELGFDFLRDNMKLSADETVQRERDVAIVDEADQTLIDEGRNPPYHLRGPTGQHTGAATRRPGRPPANRPAGRRRRRYRGRAPAARAHGRTATFPAGASVSGRP